MLTNARRGARINTGQSGTMMQLGKGQTNSVAVTLNGDGYIICMAPRPPGSKYALLKDNTVLPVAR